MLSLLHIENIAVIECADISFDAGFNVLTGETGAGKSIIIDSVGLIIGARASRELIRGGEGKAMVSALFENISEEAIISWIPRSKKAKAKEGHDQAELVCRQLSELLGAQTKRLILRRHGSLEQKKLDSKERSKNIKNSFAFNEKYRGDTGKAVILFDDIVTTGASMAEAVSLLRKNGFKTIICVTIATVM